MQPFNQTHISNWNFFHVLAAYCASLYNEVSIIFFRSDSTYKMICGESNSAISCITMRLPGGVIEKWFNNNS